MARKGMTLERVSMFIGIGVGLLTLYAIERKRRGIAGDACATTDDCQRDTHCVNGVCVPYDSTAEG